MDPRLTSYQSISGQEIRIFNDAVIQRAIDLAIARAKPDKGVCAVAHVDNEGGIAQASVSLLVRLGDEWSISVAAYKPADRPLSYGAEVVWTP